MIGHTCRSTRLCRYEATQQCTMFTIAYTKFLEAMEDNDKARAKFVRWMKRR